MTAFTVPSASKLSGWVLLWAAALMVFLWVTIAFWGVVFLAKGMDNFAGATQEERFLGVLFAFIGVLLLLQVRMRVIYLRKYGLRTMVRQFLSNRILEIGATTILMIAVSIIVSLNIDIIINTVLLMPLFFGTGLGIALGGFMEQSLHLPYARFIILGSAWILQVFWMYMFAWMFVRVFLRFQRINPID